MPTTKTDFWKLWIFFAHSEIVEVVPYLEEMAEHEGKDFHTLLTSLLVQAAFTHQQTPECTVHPGIRPHPQHLIVGVLLCVCIQTSIKHNLRKKDIQKKLLA